MFECNNESSLFFHFLITFKNLIVPFLSKGNFYNITLVIWFWWIFWEANKFVTYFLDVSFLIKYGYILLGGVVIKIILFLRDVMMWTLVRLAVICWMYTASMTCFSVVEYFIPMLIILTLVIFLSGNFLLHGLLLFYWDS